MYPKFFKKFKNLVLSIIIKTVLVLIGQFIYFVFITLAIYSIISRNKYITVIRIGKGLLVNRIEVLDEDVCISLCAVALGNINPSFISAAMDK